MLSAKQSSAVNGFLEILRMFMGDYFFAHAKDKDPVMAWTGNASQLFREMNQDASMVAMVRSLDPSRVGRQLAKLQGQGCDIEMKQTHMQRLWVIRKDAKFLREDAEEPQGALPSALPESAHNSHYSDSTTNAGDEPF
jgi:hypothetical protein